MQVNPSSAPREPMGSAFMWEMMCMCNVHAVEISFTTSASVEHLWIKVNLTGTDQLVTGCVYWNPSSDPGQSVEEFAVLFNSVVMCEPSHLLICGDFNIPQIDWVHKFSRYGIRLTPSHKFLSMVQECLLFQHVTQPTRCREGDSPRILDLLFTNEEGMISDMIYPICQDWEKAIMCYWDFTSCVEQTIYHLTQRGSTITKLTSCKWISWKIRRTGSILIPWMLRLVMKYLRDSCIMCPPSAFPEPGVSEHARTFTWQARH